MAGETFSLANVLQAANEIKSGRERNELLSRRNAMEGAFQDTARQSVNAQGQYDPIVHSEALARAGYPDLAQETLGRIGERLDMADKWMRSMLPRMNAQTYPSIVAQGEKLGFITPGSFQPDYDPAYVQQQVDLLDGHRQAVFGAFEKLTDLPGGGAIYGQRPAGGGRAENVQVVRGDATADAPMDVRKWLFFNQLSPADQQRYLTMKRATSSVVNIAGVPTMVTKPAVPGVEPTTKPLSTLQDEAAGAAAIKAAEAKAANEANRASQQAQNSRAFDTYQTAMRGVEDAFGETQTGPFVGRVPAVTFDQQRAEGAVAAVAPTLKQLFRAAGEGVFTDRDQELLLDMAPKRTDLPEVVKWKVGNINAIVASKLGVPLPGSAGGPALPARADRSVGPAGQPPMQTATGPNGEKIGLVNGQWVRLP